MRAIAKQSKASSLPYNRGMRHLDLLLPFGLPHTEMAPDLLRAMKTPALATLVARATSSEFEEFDAFSRALPHEAWLSRQFGLEGRLSKNGSPAIAAAAMQAFGLKPDAGVWFMLQPVHIHIARDHLVLTDMRQLTISEQESRTLFDLAKPLFDEAGKTLLYGDTHTWFVRADDWAELNTSTPDAACGHNIDIWMPKGAGERDWRKLQNEVQMHWHTDAINEERVMRGLKPVNSLWLWGGAPAAFSAGTVRYTEVFNLRGWLRALGQLTPKQTEVANAAKLTASAPQHGLIAFDSLIESALAGDWSEWLAQLHALENDWFSPLLEALKSGKIDQIGLIPTHNTGLAKFTINRNSLRKFWVKPSLTKLVP